VHHLSPKVPNYQLEKAHDASIPLQKATTITIGHSLKSLRFRLWDEHKKTFIGFKDLERYKAESKISRRAVSERAS